MQEARCFSFETLLLSVLGYRESASSDISQTTGIFMMMLHNLRHRGNGFPSPSVGLPDFRWLTMSRSPFGHFSNHPNAPLPCFTSLRISPAYAGTGLRRRSSIRPRIFSNRFLGMATSANWNVTERPWRSTLAPIFTSFSRNEVN